MIVACAYSAAYCAPRSAASIWIGSQILGVAGTVGLYLAAPRLNKNDGALRFAGAMLMFFGFGLLWSVMLGHFGPREMNAFWATLFMFGYSIAGLWFGRAFIVLGLSITTLTVAGYLWAGDLFDLYMAAIDGCGLMLCGLWMRRA